MGRLSTMTDTLANSTLISGVTYGVANEVQAIAGSLFNETRSYNSLFQLAQITVPGALNIQYAYSSTMNNGKIASQTDVISGEQVVRHDGPANHHDRDSAQLTVNLRRDQCLHQRQHDH